MRVLRMEQVGTAVAVDSGRLPYRDARDKGPYDVIPAQGFWLARLTPGQAPDAADLGAHLMVVLSGRVSVAVSGEPGEAAPALGPGDVLCAALTDRGLVSLDWDGDAWLLYVLTPGWLPERGDNEARPDPVVRSGRPLLTWIHDDAGSSRSQPFRWPTTMAPPPAPATWPRSRGAFVTRRDYGDDAYATGVWHNGPRSQLGLTLNGSAQNETGDGTVTSPVTGDLAYIDDVTGRGHVTRGRGDRWMLFVTVCEGELAMTPEL